LLFHDFSLLNRLKHGIDNCAREPLFQTMSREQVVKYFSQRT